MWSHHAQKEISDQNCSRLRACGLNHILLGLCLVLRWKASTIGQVHVLKGSDNASPKPRRNTKCGGCASLLPCGRNERFSFVRNIEEVLRFRTCVLRWLHLCWELFVSRRLMVVGAGNVEIESHEEFIRVGQRLIRTCVDWPPAWSC